MWTPRRTGPVNFDISSTCGFLMFSGILGRNGFKEQMFKFKIDKNNLPKALVKNNVLLYQLIFVKKALRPASLLKRDSSTGAFLWVLEKKLRNLFKEHLRTAAGSNAFTKIPRKNERWVTFKPLIIFFYPLTVFSLISAGPQISAAYLGIHIEISASPLVSATNQCNIYL